MRLRTPASLALLGSLLLCKTAVAVPAPGPFAAPVSDADLDPAAYTQWVDGVETPMTDPDGPRHVVWARDSRVEWNGSEFGASKTPGPRFLRIGFESLINVGSVLVRGGGQLSVLKPSAVYPGKVDDDSQWLPLDRISGDSVSRGEVDHETYALWVAPPNTITRALRFKHTASVTDKNYQGFLGGVWLLHDRVVNSAPLAIAITTHNSQRANRINNGTNDGTWGAWDNWDENAPNTEVISAGHPETLMLIWPRPVSLTGLCALWAGFGACDVQSYEGPADRHPREAQEPDWQTIKSFDGLENYYPLQLGPNWLDFGRTVTTRAIRLRITRTTSESHPHLTGKTQGGKRVWLGEIFALSSLGASAVSSAIIPAPAIENPHPPIPIRFTLKEAGRVTLAIEDANGKRIRNLVSETPFPAGPNVVWWDGMDDLGRDAEAASHGIYSVPGSFVTPGVYHVRGLYYKGIDLRYEFSLYDGDSSPPWYTADNTGGWLANHTSPSGVLFVPGDRTTTGKPWVYIGSAVSEGTHGLAWVDLTGRKLGGMTWVGGTWTGAPYLAYDSGPNADLKATAYAGSAFDSELRLTALTTTGEKPLLKYAFASKDQAVLSGLAVWNGLIVASLPRLKELMQVDAATGATVGTTPMDDPRGLAFDREGCLLILSGTRLLRCKIEGKALGATEVVIDAGLEDPQHVTTDGQGSFYVSDRGASHQVKVFDPGGKFLRAIGKPGAPKAGHYDEQHMNNPNGITIDNLNRLWVAETDFSPKRVSIWTLDGTFVKAFYGPAEYGGGGSLDSGDKTLYNYHGMAFRLDWTKGTYKLDNVFYRPSPGDMPMPDRSGTPDTALYHNGKKYYTNCFNSNPTGGSNCAILWIERNGLAVPIAAMGRGTDWDLLKTDAFRDKWPAGIDLKGDYWRNECFFIWSDLNGDGIAEPDEVTLIRSSVGGVTVMPDLSFVNTRLDGKAIRLVPQRFTAAGVPVYDLAKGEVLANDVQGPRSSGGDQALVDPDGWTFISLGVAPYSPYSLCGLYKGVPRWSYPSPWPGLHASHTSPPPEFPGELIGTTRVLGELISLRNGIGPVTLINCNQGYIGMMTVDGLFIATLFHDVRAGKTWSMPVAQRNMLLNDLTLHDENFWPSVTQMPDGKVYLIDGARTSIIRVDGLDTLYRLPTANVTVTAADLKNAQEIFLAREALRQKAQGQDTLKVEIRAAAPTVDGDLDDWADANWATIDKRGVAAYFNANTKPYDVAGAVAVAGDRLYAAFRTGDPNLLRNTGETPNLAFKTGGALDLMIGANPGADPRRTAPVAGDVRLLVTLVKNKPLALVYRPVVIDGRKDPAAFASPWRTITFDRVDNVSDQVQVVGKDGNYELSVPLSVIGLEPTAGLSIRGDIGILRGDGFTTTQRVYWMNKATGITADIPSEAMLTPNLWGNWEFVAGG